MTISDKFSDGFLDPRPRFLQRETTGTIRSVFIANRGEVAVRIARTLRRMAITSVAVYEPGDEHSLHIVLADHAVMLKSHDDKSVFLDAERIIATAKEYECQAIHPGWGYLSEDANFIRRCEEEGLIFIGPTADTVDSLGDKVSARSIADRVGVPIPGGTSKPVKNVKKAVEEASKVGLPVLLKAAAGGGGRGIRVIRSLEEIPTAFERARSEALKAFGRGDLFIESFLEGARHIEVQILGDKHDQIFALGTRDCSLQRRRQKVVEEADATILSEELRTALMDAAIKICTEAKYVNAGTVEFLVMPDNSFAFLEVNTRLQVEHPVTEAVIGQDLVWLQVLVAAGHKMPDELGNIVPLGHAIEVRIIAEDARNNFAPQTGLVRHIQWPEHSHIRIETALVPGSSIGTKYDSMIAKIIAWGRNRNEALDRLAQALDDTRIIGVKTNVHLLRYLCDHPEFQINKLDTGALERWMPEYQETIGSDPAFFDAARAAAVLWASPKDVDKPV